MPDKRTIELQNGLSLDIILLQKGLAQVDFVFSQEEMTAFIEFEGPQSNLITILESKVNQNDLINFLLSHRTIPIEIMGNDQVLIIPYPKHILFVYKYNNTTYTSILEKSMLARKQISTFEILVDTIKTGYLYNLLVLFEIIKAE